MLVILTALIIWSSSFNLHEPRTIELLSRKYGLCQSPSWHKKCVNLAGNKSYQTCKRARKLDRNKDFKIRLMLVFAVKKNMLLGSQYQIEFTRLYVCTCVMWALRADIWQHSCIINNTDQQQHSTCYKYNMYICYNSISVSNSVSISVESLKLWWLNFHVFMASPNQRIYILNKK